MRRDLRPLPDDDAIEPGDFLAAAGLLGGVRPIATGPIVMRLHPCMQRHTSAYAYWCREHIWPWHWPGGKDRFPLTKTDMCQEYPGERWRVRGYDQEPCTEHSIAADYEAENVRRLLALFDPDEGRDERVTCSA